ncbi:MAG: alanine dehydrogenase [Rhodospirillales bacterium RIFCSPLOWO2_12_FULL_58_28]|nr:MAG: alanine dehydrogenase [Rhodospirillales bacterium RIFCSPLOWO2_02_FULL_58_16]OHC78301.1 MAG: alanine dehydrogenase [Rhodospirillales bacterium RIFCSPLOWO2_12_FULL_58_28]
MLIGVPKEIKDNEHRVGMTPPSVRELIHHGHKVVVESGAGLGIGIDDGAYRAAGASIAEAAAPVFEQADMIVKVKEPQAVEYPMLRSGQVLFAYLHLAPDARQTRALADSGVIAIAYETVTDGRGHLPLLAPMSEVAGRMSIQAGANCLEKERGGSGVLLGGVPGVEAARVVIIGGGVVGTNAARMAMGMEARVTVLDKSLERLQALDLQFGSRISTLYATVDAIERQVAAADLAIGAVLAPGAVAPKLVSREMTARMRPGSVIVDVSIDQGGCFETSRPTSHSSPTYIEEGVVHYCVTNMPGAVARTSTFALNNATLPFIAALADKGYRQAMREDPCLLAGLNVHKGRVTYRAVAESLNYDYLPPEEAL